MIFWRETFCPDSGLVLYNDCFVHTSCTDPRVVMVRQDRAHDEKNFVRGANAFDPFTPGCAWGYDISPFQG
jgi:hypothetical protein